VQRAQIEKIAEETRKAKADLDKAKADYERGKLEMETQATKVSEIIEEIKDSNVDFNAEMAEHSNVE
jgi:predicted  nucleic acid-binding Zn-ribbon protein